MQQIEEKVPNAAALVPQQFNTVTPENIMKAEIIHPEWDRYNFDLSDKLAEYGKKHNIKVNGHTLIWHSQLPVYARNIKDVDSFKTFFNNHITTIASRYNGKIYYKDVVNEALEEDGSMRKSVFLNKLGKICNRGIPFSTESSSNELYYNDYNIEQPKKRAGAITLIKR
jgi:endo-1,4-beta-xylanase